MTKQKLVVVVVVVVALMFAACPFGSDLDSLRPSIVGAEPDPDPELTVTVVLDVFDAGAEAVLLTDSGETIDELILSRGGVEYPSVVIFVLDDPDGSYTYVKWYVNGTTLTGSGLSFELDLAHGALSNVDNGIYVITIEVTYNGIPYSRIISVTVTD